MHFISVSVAFAEQKKQWVEELTVRRGVNARELITLSHFLDRIPALQNKSLDDLRIGVFAEKIELDYLLREGDRLEIYRNLIIDPKQARRELAKLNRG